MESLSQRLLHAGIPVRSIRKILKTRICPKKTTKYMPPQQPAPKHELEKAKLLILTGQLALDRAVKLFSIPPEQIESILQDQ